MTRSHPPPDLPLRPRVAEAASGAGFFPEDGVRIPAHDDGHLPDGTELWLVKRVRS